MQIKHKKDCGLDIQSNRHMNSVVIPAIGSSSRGLEGTGSGASFAPNAFVTIELRQQKKGHQKKKGDRLAPIKIDQLI